MPEPNLHRPHFLWSAISVPDAQFPWAMHQSSMILMQVAAGN
jgi:hypothetical protein